MNVAILIPAYNEERTIQEVVTASTRAKLGTVTVISDGSTDRTAERARAAGARVLELPTNLGKGGAIQAGLDHTNADIVMLLDADLIGLTAEHLHRLVQPIVTGSANATVGLFTRGRITTTAASWLTRHWSGQRAFHRELLSGLNVSQQRYAVELAITDHWRERRARVRYVALPSLTHRTKEEKLGANAGLQARLGMFTQLLRYRLARRR